MPDDTTAVAVRKPTARSKVTNGSRLFLSADGRSGPARRQRDLVDELARPFGGMANLDEPMRSRVRSTAALMRQREVLESGLARGERIDTAELVSTVNALNRELEQLEAKRPKPRSALDDLLGGDAA